MRRIQLDDGSLPLLAPMSEVAGRLSIQVGAWCLQKPNGGAGILLGGASGVRPAKVVVLGAGIAGSNAARSRRALARMSSSSTSTRPGCATCTTSSAGTSPR